MTLHAIAILINNFIFCDLKVERFVEIVIQQLTHARRQFWLTALGDESERHLDGLFSIESNCREVLFGKSSC